MASAGMSRELADAILASAGRLGIDPLDLGTAISYETAATFDPWKAGPTTQYGQHRGLLQWGGPQRQKYGVTQDMSVADQLRAAERYLTDAGVKPGHGLLDIYSAINAGRVGRYNASDANNGGAPGSVADKVRDQMSGHRVNAARLLGLPAGAITGSAPAMPGANSASVPLDLGDGSEDAPIDNNALLQALQTIAKQTMQEPAIEAPAISYFRPNAQRLAGGLSRLKG